MVADVTNALASFYVEESARQRDLSAESRKERSAETVQLLKSQLAGARRRLDDEERRVGQFKSSHLRELPEQVPVNLATIERLNARLEANRARRTRLLSPEKAPVQLAQLDGPSIRLARMREELRELQPRVSDLHPDLVRLRAQIAAATLAAGSSPSRAKADEPGSAEQAELRALDQEDRILRQAIPSFEDKVYNAPKREQELQTLLPNYQATKAHYDSLLARLEEATLAGEQARGREAGPFQIVDSAIVSRTQEAPNRLRLLLLGLLLCGALALGATLLAEKLDTSFHSLDELRSLTRVAVLSTIPQIVTSQDAARRSRRLVAAALIAALALFATIGGAWAVARDNEGLTFLLAKRSRA